MKMRLDKLLVEKGLAETRSKALGIIMAGQVLVDGKAVTKAGTAIEYDSSVSIKPYNTFVSRGALKLRAALDAFSVDVKDMVALDIGSSTGGFTDVMLKRGAKKVYAVDVGHGQLHWRLRTDPRVVCLEGVNARMIGREHIPEPCDMATFDVSFISLRLVIPPVLDLLKSEAHIIALIKPQFEAGRLQVGKGGVIRDLQVHEAIVRDLSAFLEDCALQVSGVIPSPIKGAKGNQEYLIHAMRKAL
ncbi:MAG: TlyA family RNA methyltransferase [Desulfomonilia bacterium]|jgi:23S rRNA (cytidine1920-2'-O)/16S rRNA (cytidine1409-2'-O)-methyltransferase